MKYILSLIARAFGLDTAGRDAGAILLLEH